MSTIYQENNLELISEMKSELAGSEKHPKLILSKNQDSISPVAKNQSEFEINQFFNGLPIRILGTHLEPFFYAEDMAAILNIKKIRTITVNFDPIEIVSAEQRQRHNIITYKSDGRRDNTKILLTEFGVYRLMMINKSQLAEQFRLFMYRVLHDLRTKGFYQVNAELQQLKVTNEQLLQLNNKLEETNKQLQIKQSQFKNLCEKLYLVEIPRNVYEVEQSNIPAQFTKKSSKKQKSIKNIISDPYPYAVILDQELGLKTKFIDVDPRESMSNIRIAHEQNNIIARQIIESHAPKSSYIVTDKVTPELLTAGSTAHSIWVREPAKSLAALNKKLDLFKPMNVKDRCHFYTCDKQKIIDAMNAVAD
jgi:prophage antirepressor-like protein